jgi:hypothetical protein
MFLSTRANGSDPPGLVLSKHAFQGTVKGFTAGIFFLSAQALSAIIMVVLPTWDFPQRNHLKISVFCRANFLIT